MASRAQPTRTLLLASTVLLLAPSCRDAGEPASPDDRLALVMALDSVERCDDLARRTGNSWRELQSSGEAPYDRFPDAVAYEMAAELSHAALELAALEELLAAADDPVPRELFESGRALCRLALEPGEHLGSFDQLQGGIRWSLKRTRERHHRALRVSEAERAEVAGRREQLVESARRRALEAMSEHPQEDALYTADEIAERKKEWIRHWRYQEELRRRRAENRRKTLEAR